MSRKIVLILQGGGALGAFQCGAWKVLSPFMREHGHELVAVAGASIGAVNAALIARHCQEDDGGYGVLQDFWRNQLAMPSVPFFPFPGQYWRAWNGVLTGLLLGNRKLFSPAYQNWTPLGELFRFHMPLYQTQEAEQTLAHVFGEYHGKTPLLAVGASDVQSGELLLFDSAGTLITPRMITASLAIPILFSPVEIDGRYYWDAEMRSNTLLPHILARMPEVLLHTGSPEDVLVIVVDMFQAGANHLPESSLDSHYRLLNIFLGNKLRYEQRGFESSNAYLFAMERLRALAIGERRSRLTAAVEAEYRKALKERRARVDILHIGREQFEYEHISRDFDYSPEYIDRLIAQGVDSASQAIRRYEAASE